MTEQLSVGANSERFFGGVRCNGEVYNVGDTVFVNCDRAENDVMRIDALWADVQGRKWFEGRWYYRPDETTCGKLVGHDQRELFETAHVVEDHIEAINGHCTVMAWDDFQRWLDEPSYENDEEEQDTTFVCRAAYHIGSGEFVPLNGASSLAEAVRLGQRASESLASSARVSDGKQLTNRAAAGKRARGSTEPSWGDVLQEHSRSGGEGCARGGRLRARDLFAGGGEGGEEEMVLATGPSGVKRRRRLGRFAEAAARLAPSAAPERMPCREKERDEVIGVLRSAVLEGALGGSLYLSGTPGTGKTATVHQALRALAADKSLPSFRTIFVNGMKLASPFEVYSLLWEALTGQAAKPARAVELLERRFFASPPPGGKFGGGGAHMRKAQTEKVVLVLDELDYLVTTKQSVIYNLFEWATRGSSHMLVVGISNTMDLPERLLPRVESRLNIRRVNFLPYKFEDIEAIIADRLTGLDAFGAPEKNDGLILCARKVASVSGDVRRALETCRLAAQVAEREEAAAHAAESSGAASGAGNAGGGRQCGASRAAAPPAAPSGPRYVTIEHITEALRMLKGSHQQVAVEAAPLQHKLLLACMVLLMESSGRSEVHEAALRQRHRAICITMHSDELPVRCHACSPRTCAPPSRALFRRNA